MHAEIDQVGGRTRARPLRELSLASGINMLVMDTGGSVVADTAVPRMALSTPPEMRLGPWPCQELVGPNPALGRVSRNENGHARAPAGAGLGVAPDPEARGPPVAMLTAADG